MKSDLGLQLVAAVAIYQEQAPIEDGDRLGFLDFLVGRADGDRGFLSIIGVSEVENLPADVVTAVKVMQGGVRVPGLSQAGQTAVEAVEGHIISDPYDDPYGGISE